MQSYKQLLIDWLEYEAREKGLVDVKFFRKRGMEIIFKGFGVNPEIIFSVGISNEELACQEIVDILTSPEVLRLHFV